MNPELISQYYSTAGMYNQFVQQQDSVVVAPNSKPKRRRKKNKADQGGGDSVMMRKRKLTEEQMNMLEQSFGNEHKLESERKDRLAAELGLDPRQVAVWFQNRRARWKTKMLEEEYSKLKSQHDSTIAEKCHLETELLQLKERLVEAEKEIHRLSDGFTSNSPSSSFSIDPPFLGDFGMEGPENAFYLPQDNYVHDFEWDAIYYM